MNHLRLALPLALVLPLVACIPIPVPEGTPGSIQIDPGDSCGARDLRGYLGQPALALEGARLVGADGSPVTLRVIRPGDAVTEDVVPTRVNLRTDAAGIIAAVDCG